MKTSTTNRSSVTNPDNVLLVCPSGPNNYQKIENENKTNSDKDWNGFDEVLQGEDGREVDGVWGNHKVATERSQVVTQTLGSVDGSLIAHLEVSQMFRKCICNSEVFSDVFTGV